MANNNNKELIYLQHSHITQHTKNGIKGEWMIKKNETCEVLQVLPAYITDADMFIIINFAKKYELDAFNAGITLQKDKQNVFLKAQVEELKNSIYQLSVENERLATILDKTTSEAKPNAN